MTIVDGNGNGYGYGDGAGLACDLCGEILCRHYESYDDRPDEWRGENAEAERTKEMNEMNEKAEAGNERR